MKKYFLFIFVSVLVLMMGCVGDDPAGPEDPEGTLPVVTGLTIDESASEERTVYLSWDPVTSEEIDGYYVWFKSNGSGNWDKISTTSNTSCTHEASCAGDYVVTAYEGENTSSADSDSVTTLPNFVPATYTIWDFHAPEDEYSGFKFGANSGEYRYASTSTDFDVYCYDGGGGYDTWLYSGDYGTYGNGYDTDIWDDLVSNAYPDGYPSGSWNHGYVSAGDIFICELSHGYFVKMYITTVMVHPDQPAAYGFSFYYDWQPINGLYLFTEASSL
ncbi:MAG: fibronectin type III domain-containing protein [FCB group bacterium]|nr:fibronectin type III domain-containing protein [FCB group bacterium]